MDPAREILPLPSLRNLQFTKLKVWVKEWTCLIVPQEKEKNLIKLRFVFAKSGFAT
jgi:hypothetical protein